MCFTKGPVAIMRTPPFETSLRSQLQVMQRPRCARERRERWSQLPELLGGDVEVLADRLTSPVIREQNPVFAALVRLHLAGDADASTILLHGSTALFYRALPPHVRCREELVGTAWSILALTLSDFSEADLDSYVARRRPLMGVLYGRLRPRLIRLADRYPSGMETLELDRPIAAEGWGADPDEQAIEAVEVARVAAVARSCGVTAEQWAMVVDIRAFGVPGIGRHRTMVTRVCQRIRAASGPSEAVAA